MAAHLIKLAVGIEDLDHLARVQAARADGGGRLPVFTRQTPRRAAEIIDGGSLYWVVRGWVAGRQRVLSIETGVDGEGRKLCALIVERALHAVAPTPRRPFQGWRYLECQDAPPDQALGDDTAAMPAAMRAELRALGLL